MTVYEVSERRAAGARPPSEKRGRPPAGELSGLRVLFVDNHRDTRDVVSALLESRGAEVVTSGSAADALWAFRRFRPDVLISDIRLPYEDGYRLIERVRSLGEEEGGRTPSAALTACARADDRERALRAGFQLHLPKPADPDELFAAVAALAGRAAKS